MSAQEQIALKRQIMAQQQKESSELGAMIAELKKMQMAAMMGQSKPSVILTDQTDLGDKIKELTTRLTDAVKSTDTTSLTKDQLSSLKTLESGLERLTKAIYNSAYDGNGHNAALIKAIKSIDLKPVVNLPAPIVNVEAKDIDFSPIKDTLQELLQPKEAKIDLSCYRAQDIKESGDIQYVGFVNPEGNWYIIENDMRKNKMRYVFGKSGYSKHFRDAASYVYKLMDKAIADAS